MSFRGKILDRHLPEENGRDLKRRRSIAPLLELRVDLSQVAKLRVTLSQATMTTESIKGKNFQIIINQMEVDVYDSRQQRPEMLKMELMTNNR